MNNISLAIIFKLLDKGMKVTDIDKILVNTLKKSDRGKFRQYYLYKTGNNKCSICGTNKCLELHHIKPVVKNPELEYDTDNVTLLCENCHDVMHGRNNKFNNLDSNLNSKIRSMFKNRLHQNINKG